MAQAIGLADGQRFFHLFLKIFLSLLQPFLIEGVLGSIKLFQKKFIRAPNNLGLDPFPDPVGHFGSKHILSPTNYRLQMIFGLKNIYTV